MKPNTDSIIAAFVAGGGRITKMKPVAPIVAMESYRATTRLINDVECGRVNPVRVDWFTPRRDSLSATFRGTHT